MLTTCLSHNVTIACDPTHLQHFVFQVCVDNAGQAAVAQSVDDDVSIGLGTGLHKQLGTCDNTRQQDLCDMISVTSDNCKDNTGQQDLSDMISVTSDNCTLCTDNTGQQNLSDIISVTSNNCTDNGISEKIISGTFDNCKDM